MRFRVMAVAMLCFSAHALAANEPPPTPLDRCALLLPEGRTYTFKIEGTAINNGRNETKVQRKVSVTSKRTTVTRPADSRKPQPKAAAKEKMEAFRHCLAKAL